jgi:hypothetical protein
MAEKVIDIYEKYGNLFKLKITPPIEKLHELPFEEKTSLPVPSNYPIIQRCSKDKCFSLMKVEGSQEQPAEPWALRKMVRGVVCSQIVKTPGLQLDAFKTKITNKETALKSFGDQVAIIHPGCRFRIMTFGEGLYLCIDYAVEVKNYLRANEVKKLLPDYRFNLNKGYYEDGIEWKQGRIEDVEGEEALVLTNEGSIKIPSSKFLPDVPATKISKILARKGIRIDFDRELKSLALLTVENAPKKRFQKIVDMASALKSSVFPFKVGGFEIDIDPDPVRLMPPNFDVRTDITEPFSAFDHEDETKRSRAILDGLTRHGSFEKPKKDIKVVILTTKGQLANISTLLNRVINGADKYPGMGKTFGTNIKVMETLTTGTTGEYLDQCKAFVRRPDFNEAELFLVYMPEEEGKASYDSPYYEVKKFLIKNGIPSQMVDEDTLRNPRFKDLNIALNIFAKAGYTPWVLDEELEDVDLFIGLSYSSIRRERRIDRMMAYVNVFDKYGRWKFYQGDIEAFPFDERHEHYKEIIKASINRYRAENPDQEIRKIHIHYGQKIRKHDLEAINEQVQAILPGCQVFFVYINTDLPIRLFDLTTQDGSLERGSYVITEKNQFCMSTTGANIFGQKGMGTPKILVVSVQKLEDSQAINLRTVAQHILSLTRLNWASTRNFCHEPITTKYASDIAYFMNVFMNDTNFSISERIRNKPWFL